MKADRKQKRNLPQSSGAAQAGIPRTAAPCQVWLKFLAVRALWCALAVILVGKEGKAQDTSRDLADLDLDRLMNVEVTSVSGRPRKVSHTASAITVITAEDIRRAGATSIPEALRLAPGLQVAQINDSVWAIGARGFAERWAGSLLVLVDGRSLYTPAFGGVEWDVHNLMLEDVERIEVIRGPGASLWGGNAVNGVINIITRHSRDTQGGLLTTSVGSHERVHSNLRYGGGLGQKATYRVYAQYFTRDASRQVSGEPAGDAGDVLQGGFRADWNPSPSNSVIFTGDLEDRDSDSGGVHFLFRPSARPILLGRSEYKTSSLMGRWQRFFTRGDDFSLQWSYDSVSRDDRALEIAENRKVISLDFRHHVAVGNRQDFLWGVGFNRFFQDTRGTADFSFGVTKNEASGSVSYAENHANFRYLLFAQNEIAIVPGKLFLIPGAKLQHETHSGLSLQPNLRVLWNPNSTQTVWGSIARAVRTPTGVETISRITLASLGIMNSLPAFLAFNGNDEFQSPSLVAYELGYRAELRPRISLDVATFYNIYHDLNTAEPGRPFFTPEPPLPRLVIPLQFDNRMDGETYGVEVAANWRVNNWWTLRGSYSWLEMQLHRRTDSRDAGAELYEGNSPNHQFNLRSNLRLPRNLELNTSFYYVSALPSLSVPAHTRLDSQITWHPLEQIAVSLGGQNLLEPRHPEFSRFHDLTLAGQAERNVYTKITWRF